MILIRALCCELLVEDGPGVNASYHLGCLRLQGSSTANCDATRLRVPSGQQGRTQTRDHLKGPNSYSSDVSAMMGQRYRGSGAAQPWREGSTQ